MKKNFTLRSLMAAFIFFGNVCTAYAVDLTGSIISSDKGTVTEGVAYVTADDEVTLTIELSCADLTQDFSLSAIQPYPYVANPADVKAITPALIQASTADKSTIAVTIKPSTIGDLTYCLEPSSRELTSYYLWININVTPNTDNTLSSFLRAYPDGSNFATVSVEGDFVVTHIWEQPYDGWSQTRAYLQDATAGVFIHYWNGLTCKVGDHYNTITGALHINLDHNSQGMYGMEGTENYPLPEPTATDTPAEPSVIKLSDAAKHHGRLVRINNVAVSDDQDIRSDVLTIDEKVAITAGDVTAHITLFPGSDLLGEPASTISGSIDLVGIIRSVADGEIIISPRGKADILESSGETTVLQHVQMHTPAVKVLEDGQVYIMKDGLRYNVLGIQVR